jgi:hypothetical protein
MFHQLQSLLKIIYIEYMVAKSFAGENLAKGAMQVNPLYRENVAKKRYTVLGYHLLSALTSIFLKFLFLLLFNSLAN